MPINIVFCSPSEDLLPYKATQWAIWRDLKLSEDCTVPFWSAILAWTGVKIAMPQWRWIKIYARSSLPIKYWVFVANSVWIIDSDYRWELKVQLSALWEEKLLKAWTRIAQVEIFHYPIFKDSSHPERDEDCTLNVDTEIPSLEFVADADMYEYFTDRFPTQRWAWSFGSTWE